MNKKLIFSALAILSLSMGFTACSSDDNEGNGSVVPQKESSSLVLDSTHVDIGVGEVSTLNIKKGAGDYKLFVEDKSIVTATLEGNSIKLESKKNGSTGVVLSDKDGNYQRILVKSMYLKLAFEKDVVTIAMKRGHKDVGAKVKVTAGNGGYVAVSDAENVVTVVNVQGDVINLRAVSTGTTKVKVTDRMGLTKDLEVKVEATTVPFTQEEKDAILALTNSVMIWDSNQAEWANTYKVTETEIIQSAYGMDYFKITLNGGLSEGKKENCSIDFQNTSTCQMDHVDGVTVEILKNDGKRIWGIIYKLDADYLHTGYFTVPSDGTSGTGSDEETDDPANEEETGEEGD